MADRNGKNADDGAGFQTSGYIDKKGTPNGENAKFNYLPPGHDIYNQECADFAGPGKSGMPYKTVTPRGYPGSGAFGNEGSGESPLGTYNKN